MDHAPHSVQFEHLTERLLRNFSAAAVIPPLTAEEIQILTVFLISLKLFAQLFILQPLRFVSLTDSVFPTVGALIRLNSAAEDKAALISYKNHFHHPENQYISFLADYQLQIPAGRSGLAAPFSRLREGFF